MDALLGFLVQSLAQLFALVCIMAVTRKMMEMVVSVAALPTYLTLYFLEHLLSGGRAVNSRFSFRVPKKTGPRNVMAYAGTWVTICVVLLLFRLVPALLEYKKPALLEPSTVPLSVAVGWFGGVLLMYTNSYFYAEEDSRPALERFHETALPDFLKKLLPL